MNKPKKKTQAGSEGREMVGADLECKCFKFCRKEGSELGNDRNAPRR